MNNQTILQTDSSIFARMAFTQNVLTEGQLLELFTAAAHKKQSAIKTFDTWLFDTERQLKQLQDSLYSKSHCCPTLRSNLIARFEKHIRVIKRFEAQFQMGCPCAKRGARTILKSLGRVQEKMNLLLLYITI